KGEAIHTGIPGELRLHFKDSRLAQIVVAQASRNMRLVMSIELRSASPHVDPLGKARFPPHVVFRYRMKLRQVECDCLCSRASQWLSTRRGARDLKSRFMTV